MKKIIFKKIIQNIYVEISFGKVGLRTCEKKKQEKQIEEQLLSKIIFFGKLAI